MSRDFASCRVLACCLLFRAGLVGDCAWRFGVPWFVFPRWSVASCATVVPRSARRWRPRQGPTMPGVAVALACAVPRWLVAAYGAGPRGARFWMPREGRPAFDLDFDRGFWAFVVAACAVTGGAVPDLAPPVP